MEWIDLLPLFVLAGTAIIGIPYILLSRKKNTERTLELKRKWESLDFSFKVHIHKNQDLGTIQFYTISRKLLGSEM